MVQFGIEFETTDDLCAQDSPTCHPFHPSGLPIERQTVSQMVDRVLALPEGWGRRQPLGKSP